MFLCLFRIFVRHVQIDMVFTPLLHLVIDRTGYDITRSQRKAGIVFLHEFLATLVPQDGPIPSHRFRDKEGGTIAWMEQGGWVELYELHIFYGAFRTVDHGDTVSGSYQRVCRIPVDSLTASGCHNGYLRQESMYLSRFLV